MLFVARVDGFFITVLCLGNFLVSLEILNEQTSACHRPTIPCHDAIPACSSEAEHSQVTRVRMLGSGTDAEKDKIATREGFRKEAEIPMRV